MKFNTYRLYRKYFGIFSALSVISFSFFYFDNYLLFSSELSNYASLYDTLEYIRFATSELIDFLIFSLTAVLIFPKVLNEKAYRAYPTALFVCSAHVFYNVPYYYLYHIAYGYDTAESLSICIPFSVFLSALYALYAVAIAYACKLIFKKCGGSFEAAAEACNAPALGTPISRTVFWSVFIHFSIRLVGEIIDTVIFFIEFSDSYRIGELLYILGSFVYILLVFIFSLFISSQVYNHSILPRLKLIDTDNKPV